MKHLKLFEAYKKEDNIFFVNNILIGHLLFKFFVEKEIKIEADKDYAPGLIYYLHITIPGVSEIFDYHLITHDKLRDMTYTSSNRTALYKAKKLLSDYFYLDVDIIQQIYYRLPDFDGAHVAASRYIDYLKNTPDKKHLWI